MNSKYIPEMFPQSTKTTCHWICTPSIGRWATWKGIFPFSIHRYAIKADIKHMSWKNELKYIPKMLVCYSNPLSLPAIGYILPSSADELYGTFLVLIANNKPGSSNKVWKPPNSFIYWKFYPNYVSQKEPTTLKHHLADKWSSLSPSYRLAHGTPRNTLFLTHILVHTIFTIQKKQSTFWNFMTIKDFHLHS